ncbi:hypothetical protein GCM10010413_45820 [Promicromonospora sukumoe]
MADDGSVSPSISQGETGCSLSVNIHFPLQSPGRVLSVWNANTVPLTGDHPVIPVFRKEKHMSVVDIVSTLLDSLGITLAQIRVLLGF